VSLKRSFDSVHQTNFAKASRHREAVLRVLGRSTARGARALLILLFVMAAVAAPAVAGNCPLGSDENSIQHVIYIQFDNTHFTRDNPNVPSDLEQMPHLRNFLKNNGTILTNHHTPLISHTATDILTSLTRRLLGSTATATGCP